jgi:hypothetical protein
MPQAQYINSGFLDLVSHFIMSNKDAADFARFEFFEFFTDSRLFQKAGWSGRRRFYYSGCRPVVIGLRKS